jgi:plastocyanin
VKRAIVGALAAVVTALATTASASAATSKGIEPPGTEHLHFAAGPYRITPGANLILLDTNHIPKPTQDGYMVRFAPNLHYAAPNGRCCGAIPRVDVIHLHHGVWLSNGQAGAGEGNGYVGGFYPFMAAGEEKTIYQLPRGYGYPIRASDFWAINYMIHDLTARPATVYITYDIDFVPADSPSAAGMKAAHPIWMDVEDHNIYPVFDVHRYSGKHGIFTFPDMAKHPVNYVPGQQPLNVFNVTHAATLLGTAGHVHPGGLYDELDLIRPGAKASRGAIRGPVPHSVRLFRSLAHYFDKRGPISWDMAMTATARDWRVRVQPGDQLRISATYETRRASWYESMGIMVVWETWDDTTGTDPFDHKLDQTGHVTHGHLNENRNHGGARSLGINLKKFPTCRTNKVSITGFSYDPGDFTAFGRNHCTPTVTRGHSITFTNLDSAPTSGFDLFNQPTAYTHSIFHSVTSCQYPCGLNTGISYPLANGAGNYDSGQLGPATPAVGRITWTTPANLKPGTYTYFCRIHPFMRGVFRVIQ